MASKESRDALRVKARMALEKDELATFFAEQRLGDFVDDELVTQLLKWGVQDHDSFFWFLILLEEVGEVAEALLCELKDLDILGSELLEEAVDVGEQARERLEGEKKDRKNKKTHLTQNVNHELVQVAAVAVAFVENRTRNKTPRKEPKTA